MKLGAKIALGLTAALAAAGLAIYGAGSLQPREHTASATVEIDAPVDAVWVVVRNYDRLHQWAPDMVPLQRLEDTRPSWAMEADGDRMVFTMVEEVLHERLVVDLATESGVFGGRWVYDLTATELGTQVTITEEGWVGPPPFRLFMVLTDAYDDTVIAHSQALKAHLEG